VSDRTFIRMFAVSALLAIAATTPAAMIAEAASSEAATVAPAMEPYTTQDTPIGTLLDDPQARTILQKYIPALVEGRNADRVRSSSLKSIQGYSGGLITDKMLTAIDADLLLLGPKPVTISVGNVSEAKVKPYTLPDPLVLANGKQVTDAKTWWQKRRPEILAMFETQQYGVAPGRPRDERFEVFDKGTPAFDGKAVRKQVLIHLFKDPAGPTIQLVEYLPAAAKRPVPMFLMICFTAASSVFDDKGIREGMVWNPETKQKVPASQIQQAAQMKFNPLPFLEAGIGVAAFYYGDVDPDFPDGYALGIRALDAKGDEASRAPDAWGSIAAWAWALSRAQDYLETDKSVNAQRVAIYGASRLGKTVLWAAARDQRFAAVIDCCSGKSGAALSRRNFGETIGQGPGYWFAPNYRKYADNETALPFDAHMLLALIAPRPVLLQTGQYDYAADPKGEFLAAVAAGPVYRLLGKQDLGTSDWPPSGPILNDIGYTMNSGGHGPAPGDWNVYLEFLKKHLLPET
jgi:hypothetical protein